MVLETLNLSMKGLFYSFSVKVYYEKHSRNLYLFRVLSVLEALYCPQRRVSVLVDEDGGH